MYIWIILSMFITALYAFNLHVRQDSRALYIEPQAQMLVSKIALQHDAAREFFYYVNGQVTAETNRKGYVCKKDEDGNCKTDEDGRVEYELDGTTYATAEEDPFTNETAKELGDYTRFSEVPVNYDISQHMDKSFITKFFKIKVKNLAKNSHSRVFCVDPHNIISSTPYTSEYFGSCEGGKGLNCCYDPNSGGGSLYVVTWAPIPVRWQYRDKDGKPNGLPNRDMVKAFAHFGLTNVEFGYFFNKDTKKANDEAIEGNINDIQTNAETEYTASNFKYFIKGFKDTPTGIPTSIGEELKKVCGNSAGKPSCLVSISQIK